MYLFGDGGVYFGADRISLCVCDLWWIKRTQHLYIYICVLCPYTLTLVHVVYVRVDGIHHSMVEISR